MTDLINRLENADTLWEFLHYDPETGALTWKERSAEHFTDVRLCAIWNTKFAEKPALNSLTNRGYKAGRLFNKHAKAHRIAWAMGHGEWPDGLIDHINHDKADNRLANLRLVTASENQRNRPRLSTNTSGVTGVNWRKAEQKWAASIRIYDDTKHLGYFDRKEDAIAARKAAEQEHGFHKNHGKPALLKAKD